jgi:hypothetical protein
MDNSNDKKRGWTDDSILLKIRELYYYDNGKRFIIHLLKSFIPSQKYKEGQGNVCCVTSAVLISGAPKETMDSIRSWEATNVSYSDGKMVVRPGAFPRTRNEERMMPVRSEHSDRVMCAAAYSKLYEFFIELVASGARESEWLTKDVTKEVKKENVKEEKVSQEPKVATFADLGVLQELKKNIELKDSVDE